jgi:hypothetical protein
MQETASDPSVTVQIVLPVSLADRLREIARSRGVGLSTLVRMLLYASLEKPA